MKKNLFVLVFLMLIVTGCSGNEVSNKVVGNVDINGSINAELMFEWDKDDPNTMYRATYTDTYYAASEEIYGEQVIECLKYKLFAPIYNCSVEKKDGNVIVKHIITRGEKDFTAEQAITYLTSYGYTIK